MALKTPYCDVACADAYLPLSVIWLAADAGEKGEALFWGRIYLDAHYTCPDHDEDDPSDNIKYANALLAEDFLDGTLTESDGASNPRIKRKRKKAGPIEQETEYMGAYSVDYQEDVTALLTDECTSNRGGTRSLTRN